MGERDSSARSSLARYAAGASPATHDPTKISSDLLVDIRERLALEAVEGQMVEAHINTIGEFLMGTLQALRVVNPQVFQAMADQWAQDICTGRHKTDTDLVLFARLASIEGRIASARALGCSLEGRTQEDFVLWSLLRAWNAAGRPPIAALDDVARSATDERTKIWLVSPEERRQMDLQKANMAVDMLRAHHQRDIPTETPGR